MAPCIIRDPFFFLLFILKGLQKNYPFRFEGLQHILKGM
jgi:hypothetical protein